MTCLCFIHPDNTETCVNTFLKVGLWISLFRNASGTVFCGGGGRGGGGYIFFLDFG